MFIFKRDKNSKSYFVYCFDVNDELKALIRPYLHLVNRDRCVTVFSNELRYHTIRKSLNPKSESCAKIFDEYSVSQGDRYTFVDTYGLLSSIPLVVQFDTERIYRLGYVDTVTEFVQWIPGSEALATVSGKFHIFHEDSAIMSVLKRIYYHFRVRW